MAAPSTSPTLRPLTGRIAYVHNSGELGGVPITDIWIVDASGGQPTALTSDPQNEFTPFWLLDGSRLVFAVFDFSTAAGPYHGRLVSVLPDGSGRKDLAPVDEFDDAVLSPDGRYVAWGGGGSDGITVLDRSTGTAKVIEKDGATDPIWSPDSAALLIREPLLAAVAVVEVPSGHLTRFRKPNIEAVVGWTADGKSVVFSGPESETTPTWMAPRAGGDVVDMPPDTELASPAWTSPDGQWKVDAQLQAEGATGGSDPMPLAAGLTLLVGVASWSRDSAGVAFAGSRTDEIGDRISAIYVVGLDGRTPARLTTGPQDTWPSWDPAP